MMLSITDKCSPLSRVFCGPERNGKISENCYEFCSESKMKLITTCSMKWIMLRNMLCTVQCTRLHIPRMFPNFKEINVRVNSQGSKFKFLNYDRKYRNSECFHEDRRDHKLRYNRKFSFTDSAILTEKYLTKKHVTSRLQF